MQSFGLNLIKRHEDERQQDEKGQFSWVCSIDCYHIFVDRGVASAALGLYHVSIRVFYMLQSRGFCSCLGSVVAKPWTSL